MNQTDTVSRPSSSLTAAPRHWLDNIPLRLKLYIGLGTSIVSLLVVTSVASYASVVNQRIISQTLTRKRQLTGLTSEISTILLDVQNQALAFSNAWASTGFEQSYQDGFNAARRTYVIPMQEQIDEIRSKAAEMEQLETGEETHTILAEILDDMDAYETNLLRMSEQMESLGLVESGEIGQVRAAMADLHTLLDETGLESFHVTLLQIGQHEREFRLHSDLAFSTRTQELLAQLEEQIAAISDDQLAPADKDRLNAAIERYRSHFLAAASNLILIDQYQGILLNRSNLTNKLIGDLFGQQQAEFNVTLQQLQRRQFNTTVIVIGLALLTFSISIAIVYVIAGQITRPVQVLGQVAGQLGAGDFDVRIPVHGQDEISAAATAFNMMADQLQAVLTGMEDRVTTRTRGLLTAAEVARAITSVLDPDELLNRVVNLAREQFNLYYVGLFLVDRERKFAVLRAGTGEAGRKMLELGHKLGVGSESMIGQCVSRDEARIALDVGEEAVRFVNPHLPDTRSEMALPLRARGQVIGAMSVQSVEEAAFDETNISILQTVADQVAVAIDNARLFADAQAALEEMESIQRRYLGQAWARYLQEIPRTSYETEHLGLPVLDKAVRLEVQQAITQKDTVLLHNTTHSALITPIALRGAVIGALGIHDDGEDRQWTADEIALINAVAERMAVAADNLRLLDETQRRAARERLVSEIASRVRTSMDPDTILKTTVQELGRALGARMAAVQVTGPDGDEETFSEKTSLRTSRGNDS